MTDLPDKKLFRVDEVAAFLDVDRSTIYRWIDHGLLAAEKYNRVIRISRESLLNFRFSSRLQSED